MIHTDYEPPQVVNPITDRERQSRDEMREHDEHDLRARLPAIEAALTAPEAQDNNAMDIDQLSILPGKEDTIDRKCSNDKGLGSFPACGRPAGRTRLEQIHMCDVNVGNNKGYENGKTHK